MKKRLIILSDIWGKDKSEWIINYTQYLEANFDIKYYDCCELGRIDKSDYTENSLHKQFVNGGIERAVERLLEIEKHSLNILAFSIGGTVAWKFGIQSNKINSLTCVSSTRLRNETIRPKGEIMLFYGADDAFKHQREWLNNMRVKYSIVNGKEHQFYIEPEFAQQLCEQVIENINKR